MGGFSQNVLFHFHAQLVLYLGQGCGGSGACFRNTEREVGMLPDGALVSQRACV